ncbi:hypothetical protein [Arthrobacter sp. 24S4-2]|uniref:hypothetical protein n=1 Tax=Arthrobacter sp. 24S4-2 TaxID=2575374 RepID=UPI0020C80A3B|nr:hypothetical protein [Arthrobacter sp. 24S4-2]
MTRLMNQRMTREPVAAARRKVRRRRMLLVSAVPGLLAVALAVKLLAAASFGSQAAEAFTGGDQAGVSSAAAGMGIANVVERHKAPFAAGDALTLAGDYAGARTLFETALADAPPGDECKIRVNLVLSIEKLADKSAESPDSGTDAARLYGEGLAAVKAAPPECFTAGSNEGSANGADGEGDRLREAEDRLKAKADQLAGTDVKPDGGADEQPQPDPEPQQSQLDKLDESAKSAQRERNDGRQRDEYLGNADAGYGTDKPW